jgi:hypothetical protein
MSDSHLAFGTTLRKRKNLFLVIIISLVALTMFLAWPITTAQSPFWEVWVVNEAGQPIEGMTVTIHYENYSAEPEGHSEQKQTDAGGYVVFSPRSLKASRWRRIVTTIQSAGAGVHASFGPHAWVMTYGNGLEGMAVSNGYLTDWTGAPPRMVSRIVAKPRR